MHGPHGDRRNDAVGPRCEMAVSIRDGKLLTFEEMYLCDATLSNADDVWDAIIYSLFELARVINANPPADSYSELTELSGRLFDAADRIRNPASKALGVDLKAAARAVSNLASVRFAVAEIAASCTDTKAARELSRIARREGVTCPATSHATNPTRRWERR
jgi:hypothetical protein